jgi:hypothetical protein
MPQLVNIEGVGIVEFEDGMTPGQIEAAIVKDILPTISLPPSNRQSDLLNLDVESQPPSKEPVMDLTQPEKGITGVEGIDAALDIPLNILQGGAAGVRMLANVFGAGSEFSENVKGVEDYFGDLMSASAKEDKEEIARIMSDAEDKGLLPQVKAAVDAFTTAPVDIVANTLGASAPIIIAGLKSAVAAPLVAFAQGMGIVKGALYDAVKEELPKSDRNLSEEEIEKLAQDSQSYTGENKL